jgi:hypothetical protein
VTEIELIGDIKYIGAGGNSKVFKCILKDDKYGRPVVLKYSNNTRANLNNYKIIKSLKLPTLKFLDERRYLGMSVLITEDLTSESEIIYVTPNSLISETEKLINSLNPHLTEKEKNKESPEAENYRYQNKLSKITNFSKFINSVIADLKLVSTAKIVIEFDSYFIGSNKKESISDIHYIIADFDNIYSCPDWAFDRLFETNKKEFLRLMTSFIDLFVVESCEKNNYDIILTEIKNIA